MTAFLQAELLKLRTTRTFVALTSVAVGISIVIVVLVTTISEPTEESVLTDVFTADLSSLFILVLAVIGITGEWRHRTITSEMPTATAVSATNVRVVRSLSSSAFSSAVTRHLP